MDNMKKLRKQRRWTQVAVHIQTGIDQSMLSKYERGERVPTVDNLLLLAKLYNTSLDYLMDLTDNPEPYPRKRTKQRIFPATQDRKRK